jgi:hypothetical protein
MGPIIRIALRYVAGFLVAKGVDQATANMVATDPDFLALVTSVATEAFTLAGAAIVVATEWAYARARKWGWAT